MGDKEGVPLAEAPVEREVVGEAVTVVERLIVDDPLSLPDGVCVGVHELDGVPDTVGDTVVVTVDEVVVIGAGHALTATGAFGIRDEQFTRRIRLPSTVD